jgi:hypothetical protein
MAQVGARHSLRNAVVGDSNRQKAAAANAIRLSPWPIDFGVLAFC